MGEPKGILKVLWGSVFMDTSKDVCTYWLVLDFGDRSLDTDPDFGRYWHFFGTIIDVCTDRNTYLSQTNMQRYSWVSFNSSFSLIDIGTAKIIKNVFFCKNVPQGI